MVMAGYGGTVQKWEYVIINRQHTTSNRSRINEIGITSARK